MLHEFVKSLGTHVGNMDIAHFSVGCIAYFLCIRSNPVVIVKLCLVINRYYDGFARTIRRSLGIDSELHLVIRSIHK